MKNRLIGSILIFIFFIEVFAVFAYADVPTTPDNTLFEYDSELFNKAIGLIKTIYPQYPVQTKPDVIVSREKFALMVTEIMGAKTNNNASVCFTDIAYDSPAASSVSFLTDIGVISPGELFYPSSPILYPQALKMAVSLAGYSVKAEANGSYPAGYIAVANSMGLTEGINSNSSEMHFSDITILLYNLLESNIFRQVVFGDTIEYSEDEGHTFLSYYHKIYVTEGVVNSTSYSGLNDVSYTVSEGQIKINNSVFSIPSNEYNDFLGHRVKAYFKKAGSKNNIVFMTPHLENVITIMSKDVGSFDGSKLTVSSGNKDINYNISRSYIYIKNSKHCHINEADHTPYFTMDSGIITLIDNDSDNVYDIVSAKVYNYSHISSVDEIRHTIADKNTNANFLNFENDCVYKVFEFINGKYEQITISDLSKDNVIAYTISEDKKLCNIYLMNDTITGTLSVISTNSGDIYIDEILYKTSSYFNMYCSNITLGTKAKFYIGPDGSVIYATALGESAYKYGWIVAVETGTGLNSASKVKIFSQEGKMITPELNTRISLNGVTTDLQTVKDAIESWNDDQKLVKYVLNSSEKITKLITSVDASSDILPGMANNKDSDFVRYYSRDNTFKYWSSPALFVHADYATANAIEKSSFRVSSSTYCFNIPAEGERGDDSKFRISKSSFSNGSQYAISAYDIDTSSLAAATLCIGAVRYSSKNRENMIIEKISSALNRKGEPSIAISGYSFENSRYMTCYAPQTMKSETDKLGAGDFVRLATDENNDIVGSIYKDFNLKDYEINITNAPTDTDYISGLIYSYKSGYMNLITNYNIVNGRPAFPEHAERNKIGTVLIDEASIMFVDVKRTANGSGIEYVTVRPSDAKEIKSYTEAGSSAHYCVARRYNYGKSYTLIIYNILP